MDYEKVKLYRRAWEKACLDSDLEGQEEAWNLFIQHLGEEMEDRKKWWGLKGVWKDFLNNKLGGL
jgi:hypothetical protein